jgi:ABC-type phosphate transport system ATPase subunit
MVTHNPEQALGMGGHTLLLVDGTLAEHGDAAQVINNPSSSAGKKYKDREMQ